MSNTQQYFVLEVIAEARKWTKLRPARLTVSSAIRRRPAATSDGQSSAAPPRPLSFPACRDFPTWASYRDLWQWIQNFSILSIVILKHQRPKFEYIPRRK